MIEESDRAAVEAQIGRPPRGLVAVAHRCSCGLPDVVETAPVLEDGTPFPTVFYLTCPRAASAIGGLEGSGVMAEMTARLADDEELAAAYRAAYDDYRARGSPGAGGMPDRVKCLHAHVAHELATGCNPFGREALEALGDWGSGGPCLSPEGR